MWAARPTHACPSMPFFANDASATAQFSAPVKLHFALGPSAEPPLPSPEDERAVSARLRLEDCERYGRERDIKRPRILCASPGSEIIAWLRSTSDHRRELTSSRRQAKRAAV